MLGRLIGPGLVLGIVFAVFALPGVAHAGSANPSSVAFGNVPINTTVTRTVTITVDAGFRTEIASGGGINAPFSFQFDTCGVGGGFTGPGTCTVKQLFTPTSATSSSGTTNVFECPIAGGSCVAIPYSVSGTGISVADATPSSVAFGNVPINTTQTRDVTIQVDAGYRTEIASGGGINAPFSFAFDTCGAGGGFTGPGTCNVKQSFHPTSTTASSGTTNVFECPIAGGSCVAIPYSVSGTGISVADATPSSVAFGNVPINTTQTRDVTIQVDAGYRTEIASGGGINAPFSFAFDTCGAGGGFTGPGTCNVKQSFHPTSTTASSGTTNVFECPIAGGSCVAIPYSVSGTGISVADATPSSVAFGNVPINTTQTRDVTIQVDAGYRTEIASGGGINAPFSFAFDTCGAGGGFTGPGTCNVKQSFHPTSTTASSGTTNVFECPIAGGSCVAIPYSVSGTGISVASATPSSVAFGNVPINTTQTRDVTIQVDTGYRTELASGSGINAPFSFDFDTCGVGGGFPGPGTCNVKQRFTPTSTTSSSGTTNVFECPIAGGSCIAIPYSVSGTGISVASATPSSVAFGNVPINTTQIRNVAITVDTGYRTELASGSGINTPFSFDFDTCGVGGGFPGPGTCNVKQRFTPTALTSSSGTTNVFECPIAGGSCIAIPYSVSGTGISVASATPSSVAFGNVPINTTQTRDVAIQVDTGYRTELASGSGINAPFSFLFDTCGAGGGFAGPGTCNVKQRFTPTALTSSSGTTNVFECPIAGGSCIAIPYAVTGTGVNALAASPPSVAFGNVPLNTTAGSTITLTIDGGFRFSSLSGTGTAAPFAAATGTCGAGDGFVGPGTCTITESYTPTGLGPSSGTTTASECPVGGGSCSTVNVPVSGTGVSVASATPSTIDLGNVPVGTTSAAGHSSVKIDAGYRFAGATGPGTAAPFTFSPGTCPAFTGPGTCTVDETFAPLALGTVNAALNLSECPVAGGTCLPIAAAVKGTGISVATAAPASLDFGPVALGSLSRLNVAITPDANFRITAASGSGTTGPFSFELRTCASFTGPGSCSARETFTPVLVGPASGSVSVSECPLAGGACIPLTIPVQGTGASTAGASPSSVDFGNVDVNDSAKQNVSVTVDAGYQITGQSGSGLVAPFGFDPKTCAGFIGKGTCFFSETFAPTVAGPASASLTLTECPVGGGACVPIPVSFTGVGAKVATTVELTSNRNPSNLGKSVTFTAKVQSTGPGTPTGTVVFKEGATTLATVPLSGKKAAFTTTTLSVGSHVITATYSGDTSYSGSTGTLTEVVTP